MGGPLGALRVEGLRPRTHTHVHTHKHARTACMSHALGPAQAVKEEFVRFGTSTTLVRDMGTARLEKEIVDVKAAAKAARAAADRELRVARAEVARLRAELAVASDEAARAGTLIKRLQAYKIKH